jgi:hypothetical protein
MHLTFVVAADSKFEAHNMHYQCETNLFSHNNVTDVAECGSSPCQNGGTCGELAAGTPGYSCTCAAGWTGTECQTGKLRVTTYRMLLFSALP